MVMLYEYSRGDMYNFFDNDSDARLAGWSQLVHRGHMRRAGVATAILRHGTLLHVQINSLIIEAMQLRRAFNPVEVTHLD